MVQDISIPCSQLGDVGREWFRCTDDGKRAFERLVGSVSLAETVRETSDSRYGDNGSVGKIYHVLRVYAAGRRLEQEAIAVNYSDVSQCLVSSAFRAFWKSL